MSQRRLLFGIALLAPQGAVAFTIQVNDGRAESTYEAAPSSSDLYDVFVPNDTIWLKTTGSGCSYTPAGGTSTSMAYSSTTARTTSASARALQPAYGP